MDRQLIYPGQIPLETDLLRAQKNDMIGLSKLAAAMLGTSTMLNGLACTPTAPAGLTVNVAPGEIYSLQNVDGTAYSSLAADTTHQIVKQGVSLDTVNLSCPAPGTAGQSINYLVQIAYTDTDTDAVLLPYYNASNPTQAYSGPNNAGTTNNTVRKGVCTVAVKAGIAATTGTQTTPAPDSGYVGAWVVTVANGQTTITSGNITGYAGAPFIPAAGLVVGGLQGSACSISAAGGTADAITGSFTPGITALSNGMLLFVRAASANATATPTFTPASGTIAAKTIVKGAGAALVAGDIAGAGHWLALQYDATLDKWALLNPASPVTSKGVTRFTANGNFTVPAGVSTIYVSGCGGGGGGGGSNSTTATGQATGAGGGGGAGQWIDRQPFSVTPGQVISLTIGANGTGGALGAQGASGGNTVIGTLVTLTGGTGGLAGGTILSNSPGGAGGAGYPAGGHGSDSSAVANGSSGRSGGGASTPFGAGGNSARNAASSAFAGQAAYGYGGGGSGAGGISSGSGAFAGAAGGAGAPGIVTIEW